MGFRAFTKFEPGYRTINGTKLNNIFTGIEAVANVVISGFLTTSVNNAVVNTVGTGLANAVSLKAQTNLVSSAIANAGVVLPIIGTAANIGTDITIFNNSANTVVVWGGTGVTIDGANSVNLSNTKRAQFFAETANTWVSAQLGIPSA